MKTDVYIVKTTPVYPTFPYSSNDHVLAALQSLFCMWGKDPKNPFGEWLKRGANAVIKPNWVHHNNPGEKNLDPLVTHTSLIKHLIDLIAVALKGEGSILIGDAPIQSCDFTTLGDRTGIFEVVDYARQTYPALDVVVEDWRLTTIEGLVASQKHQSDYEHRVADDYQVIDLGSDSFLEEISDYAERFRVTCYDPRLMGSHHQKGKHEYLVTKKVFNTDLLINLAKMKTHIKAGLTGALKNLVGINGHKEYLPHHIVGSSESGGDCYAKGSRIRDLYDETYDTFWTRYDSLSETARKAGAIALAGLWRASRVLTGDSISAGSWHGNETVWRMTLDLNHLLYFGNQPPGQIISIVDGIIAGEGEGPLNPSRKPAGLLVAGENPAYIDASLAALMGYNISRVPTVYHAIYHRMSQFAGPHLSKFSANVWQHGSVHRIPFDQLPNLDFVKPRHWRRAARADAIHEPAV